MPASAINSSTTKQQPPNEDHLSTIEAHLERIAEESRTTSDGVWLEEVTCAAAPLIRDWNIDECWSWQDWPERDDRFPDAGALDPGIDLVARTHDDQMIAIQCKSRQLDEHGRGTDIEKGEYSKFADPSSHPMWDERWLVVNGHVDLSGPAEKVASMHEKPIKLVTLPTDLRSEMHARRATPDEDCEHCQNPDDKTATQTRSCMQSEAVSRAVGILNDHLKETTFGIPVGEARGKIVLPCGTGKTRISLRIVEELTDPGEVSVVLCPSIALVSQLRREYLQHAAGGASSMRTLSVCSDQTAGYERKPERQKSLNDSPTADLSHTSQTNVKGLVTTSPPVIADWVRGAESDKAGKQTNGHHEGKLNVIFGTYQSGHRIAEALRVADVKAKVLIADEAHRTSSIRHAPGDEEEEQARRDFALCHNSDEFPATFRVYQTATPRIIKTKPERKNDDAPEKWIVRSMDDAGVFGPDLYRRTYADAVKNGWLSDYRIIALGINDSAAHDLANLLAKGHSDGKNQPTSSDYLRGFAFTLAMGGATLTPDTSTDDTDTANGFSADQQISIRSCIGFMNSVNKSKTMAAALQKEAVTEWLTNWMKKHAKGATLRAFKLEHVDASSSVAQRDTAKNNLAAATDAPDADGHGVLNVGIFGEGTDAPNLSAVAFLEPRKSPIDVIQAVGRAMRTTEDKSFGYVIVPFIVPPDCDPETWLANASQSDWPELGQILLALRAHDKRIEDELASMMYVALPPDPDNVETLVVMPDKNGDVTYMKHNGPPLSAEHDAQRHVTGTNGKRGRLTKLDVDNADLTKDDEALLKLKAQQVVTVRTTTDSQGNATQKFQIDAIPRSKPNTTSGELVGRVDVKALKKLANKMLNGKAGRQTSPRTQSTKPKPGKADQGAFNILDVLEAADAIVMNLLERSGVNPNRVERDLNLLETGVREAAHHLRADQLGSALDHHFGFNNLADPKPGKPRADGVTVAALLLMNAAMLHQRIAAGGWLKGVSPLDEVLARTDVVVEVRRQWNTIRARDFLPVIEPALDVIQVIEDTGKLAGLERALTFIAGEAVRIAESYADMGADHAGPLFNRVMGDQSSDGAFFTRPTAGSLLARLALDAADDGGTDWTAEQTWLDHKIVDLACGSGTLLQAALADMKRRAKQQGADDDQLAKLHRTGVQRTLKGFDINAVSLQLAASRLTANTQNIRFRDMGLHLMDYGPDRHDPRQVRAGSLELLGQSKIVGTPKEALNLNADQDLKSTLIELGDDHDLEDHDLEEPVDAAAGARIVITNPPFTNRTKMGEKFEDDDQANLRERVDALRSWMLQLDPTAKELGNANSIRPLFTALADKCVRNEDGVLATVLPTISFSGPSGLGERTELARRFHVHTIITCHDPREVNMSENTAINESLIVLRRHADGDTPATRKIALDRFPHNETEVQDLHDAVLACRDGGGVLADGWGEVSYWPADLIEAGDWTAGIWRSPELADAAQRISADESLSLLAGGGANVSPQETPPARTWATLAPPRTTRELFPLWRGLAARDSRACKLSPTTTGGTMTPICRTSRAPRLLRHTRSLRKLAACS